MQLNKNKILYTILKISRVTSDYHSWDGNAGGNIILEALVQAATNPR